VKTKKSPEASLDEVPRGAGTPSSRRRSAERGSAFLSGKRMLIVDDSPAVRSFAKVGLMAHKIELIEAESGDRALRILRVLPIDVVLADVNMPGTDGLSLVRQLRASDQESLRRLPVILMSSDGAERLRNLAQESGAQAFLRKPFASDEIVSVVTDLLGRRA